MRSRLWSLVILAATLSTFACRAERPELPNIVLIVPDTLRAKQLPLYGYDGIRTPAFDALAGDGVLFEHAFVKLPGTESSFSDLFSGQWTLIGGLENEELTLAEMLSGLSYRTAGFVSSRILWDPEHFEKARVRNEFNRGFDDYVQDATLERFPYHRDNEATTADVVEWLRSSRDSTEPFFLFVHYMDPHHPYEPSYDGEIEKVDGEVGRIVEELRSLGFYDDSLVILTSDHGESLAETGDHGAPRGHGWSLHTEETRVPLIIKFPNSEHIGTVRQVVRNIDILPTILDRVGAFPTPLEIDGRSLLPAVREGTELGLVAYQMAPSTRVLPEGSEGLVFEHRGTIYHYLQGQYGSGYRELYNLDEDPDENHNLFGQQETFTVVEVAQKRLFEINESLEKRAAAFVEERAPATSEISHLKSLGYLSDGAPAPYVRTGTTLMEENVAGLGRLKYEEFLRTGRWGHDLGDDAYPLAIQPLGARVLLAVANERRELFERDERGTWRALGISGVVSLANDRERGIVYIVVGGRIKALDHQSGALSDVEIESLGHGGAARGVHIGADGRLYVVGDSGVVALDATWKPVREYSRRIADPEVFAADEAGSIYFVEDGKIIKVDTAGSESDFADFGAERAGVASIQFGPADALWVLWERGGAVSIFGQGGGELGTIRYNFAQDGPDGIQLAISQGRVYIVDTWESALVYSFVEQ